jgi:RND family efflux transporter MFP subunit
LIRHASIPRALRLAAAFAAVLALMSGCGKQNAPPPSSTPPVVGVTVQAVTPSRIQDVIELDGSVAPSQRADLMARVAGALKEIHYRDGEFVQRGRLLFSIEPDTYEQQVKLNEARLAQARSDFDRQKQLMQERATSQSSLDAALANLQQAEANLALAKISLGYTQIRAPFDGVVGRHQADVGAYVGASPGGTLLATLQKLSPAYVNAAVGERDVLRLRERVAGRGRGGEAVAERVAVQATLQGEDPTPEHGVLDFIDRQVLPGTGTLAVRGRFANRDGRLLPGYYARLSIDLGQPREALLVPRAAILSDQQGDFVHVAEGDLARRRGVQTRAARGEFKEVLSGLKAGELLIVGGTTKVADGRAVQTSPAAAASGPAAR